MIFTYDKQALFDLVKKFYVLTKVKAVIFDTDFKIIVEYPAKESVFCEKMRKNKEFLYQCDKCLKEAGKECSKNNELNIYKCHSGLYEAISPITVNGVIFGYFTIGQIFEKNGNDESILEYAKQFNAEVKSEDFHKMGRKSYEQIEAAATIMQTCVAYLLLSDIIKEDDGDIILRLNAYIEKNIEKPLDVDLLCEEFSLSRNALYRLSRKFFGMPIATYIRNKKMDTAIKLLQSGRSVSTAAESVGFYDYNYFSKVFKAVKGVSPKSFKKKLT